MSERVELKGSDGLIYGEIVNGVLVIQSRQSRKHRTVECERWDIRALLECSGIAPARSLDRSEQTRALMCHSEGR
jgi:hypothetical protein